MASLFAGVWKPFLHTMPARVTISSVSPYICTRPFAIAVMRAMSPGRPLILFPLPCFGLAASDSTPQGTSLVGLIVMSGRGGILGGIDFKAKSLGGIGIVNLMLSGKNLTMDAVADACSS